VNNTNNFSARQAYEQAKDLFLKAFAVGWTKTMAELQTAVSAFKLSQSEIRLEVPLTTTNAQFIFGVTDNQKATGNNGAPFNTEIRLPFQDSLCVNEMFLYVGKPASTTDTGWQLRSYGNPVDFSAAAAAAINSTLYSHGKIEIKVNNDVLVPYRGLSNFFYKPETQQTAALGAGSPDDQFRGSEDGGITVEPNIVLIGSKNNVITLNLPSALAAADSNSRAILILRGIYAQNSTVVS
jgi:hypothetical protein